AHRQPPSIQGARKGDTVRLDVRQPFSLPQCSHASLILRIFPRSDAGTGFVPVIAGSAHTQRRGRSSRSRNINGTTAWPRVKISCKAGWLMSTEGEEECPTSVVQVASSRRKRHS